MKKNSNIIKVHRVYQIKNNLAKLLEEPLYFEFDERGLTYFQLDELNIAACVPTKQIDKAKELILEALKDGPVSAKEMESKLKDAGISEATWKRAKKDLPVTSYKEGTEWYWKRSDIERGGDKEK